ncbi:MAG: hypothetical protein AAFR51_08850 [Pseudomonadota bacterium]
MDLVETFDDADEKEWVMVDMNLPNGANLAHIKWELKFMAEDLVTQIGFKEDGDQIKLGFQSEAFRDQVLEYLDPVVRESTRMTKREAFAHAWAKTGRRQGWNDLSDEPCRYVETVEPSQ